MPEATPTIAQCACWVETGAGRLADCPKHGPEHKRRVEENADLMQKLIKRLNPPPDERDATIASLRAQATSDSQALSDLREKLERVTVQRDDARGLLEAARRLGFAQEASQS